MPFAPNKKNFESVINTHLLGGEELLAFMGVPRVVIAVTSSRFLVSTFPIFRTPALKFEAPIENISSLEVQPSGANMFLHVEASSGNHKEKMLSMGDASSELRAVIDKAIEANPNVGGASYFEEGEVEVSSSAIGEGSLRVTNRNVYIVGKKRGEDGQPDIQRKLALADLQVFDVYQGAMGARFFHVKGADGVQTYKMGGLAVGMTTYEENGVFESEWEPARMMEAIRSTNPENGKPDYLGSDEKIVCSMRSAGSMMGAIKAKQILRLTDKRLLWLEPQKDGSLQIQKEAPRDQIQLKKVTTMKSRGAANSWKSEWEVAGEKEKAVVGTEFKEAFELLCKNFGG